MFVLGCQLGTLRMGVSTTTNRPYRPLVLVDHNIYVADASYQIMV